MVTFRQTEQLLETYTFEEVLEYNELTEADVLHFLLTEEFCLVPEPHPIDYDTSQE